MLAAPWGNEDYGRALAGLGELAFQRVTRARPSPPSSVPSRSGRPRPRIGASLAETLGRAKAMIGQYDESISIFRDCLQASAERKDMIGQLRFAVLLANALIDRGDFTAAAEFSRIDAEDLRDGARPAAARAGVLVAVPPLHDAERARPGARYARRALEIVELAEDDYYTARAHELLAHVEIDRAHPEEALELLDRAWPLLARTGNPVDQAAFKLERAALRPSRGSHRHGGVRPARRREAAAGRPQRPARRRPRAATGQPERSRELYELGIEKLQAHPDRYLVEAVFEARHTAREPG